MALRRLLPEDCAIVLIGYSGGGTLAALLASRLRSVRALVTVAGNLDIEAWTHLHGYSELRGSLNPALLPKLDPRVRQFHFQGGRDSVVPPHLTSRFAARQPKARFIVFREFGHHCCWEEQWPEMLRVVGH